MFNKTIDIYHSTIKFVHEYLMTQSVCDETVNKFSFVSDSVPGWYKNEEMCYRVFSKDHFCIVFSSDKYKIPKMCDKAIDGSIETLTLNSDCFVTSKMIKELFTALYPDENILYLNKDSGNVVFFCNEMFNKAVAAYHSTIKFVHKCLMTQAMCNEAFNKRSFVFDSIPGWYKNEEMCDRGFHKDHFFIVFSSDKYKTSTMCDEAVDHSIAALKLILDWFVTSKLIKELFTALYPDENILYFNKDAGNVVFSCN